MVLEEALTTEEKKTAVSQYNVEGKQLEAFLGPLGSKHTSNDMVLKEKTHHSKRST